MRRAIRRTLARSHYVLEAATAAEARELCAHYQGKIDLLLTDLIMPHTSGAELAAEIGERWSEMRVLFMSGYADGVQVRGGLDPGKNFIAKPFLSNDLLQKVTHALTA